MTASSAPTIARELVDRGAARGKIRHHLRGDRGRKGRNALHGDAVVAGEHQHLDPVEPGRIAALPLRQPRDDLFEPAEAARRLGQFGLAGVDGAPAAASPSGRSRQAARKRGE